MKKIIKALDDHFEEYAMTALVMVMTIIVFLQVVMRYCFHNSLSWSEELARFLFLWSIWLGASYGVKTRGHITITVLSERLRGIASDVQTIVVYVIWIAFVIFLVYKGYELTVRIWALDNRTVALNIPMAFGYVSVPFGCTLMLIRMFQNAAADIKARRDREREEI